MASQDVIYEIELLRDYLDSLDDEGLTDLPAELKREVQEIRRVGIEIRDMGERKLKGLEGKYCPR
jgi:adenylate cyclase